MANPSMAGHEPRLDPELIQDDSVSDHSTLSDQDNAQAVLQPAMSTIASHLASSQTPAIEKAAAIEKGRSNIEGYFDLPPASPPADQPSDSSPSSLESTNEPQRRQGQASQSQSQAQTGLSLPSPWRSAHPESRSRQTRSVLGVAFGGPTRNRSSSAGQEALKRLQKALPSFSGSSHFLPSLRFNDSKTSQVASSPSKTPGSATPTGRDTPRLSNNGRPQTSAATPSSVRPIPPSNSGATPDIPPNPPRPRALRRVTSDDSLLYHSLSRTSSLGDDNRFHDVRDMVNMRFLALKDSLPDVPSFKMPSLDVPSFKMPKFQHVARRSQQSLNGFFNNEPTPTVPEHPSRELKDYSTPPITSYLTEEKQQNTPTPTTNTTLDDILPELTGDIVILGGYRGSILRSAEPPHQQLWAPVKLGLNMRKANLEVGFDDADEAAMPSHIIPSGMLKNIGPIDISRKFFKKLRSCENARTGRLRVWDFGYDWRLSPHRLSSTLQEYLAKLPSNQPGVAPESRGAIVIAHSLGGLITRHAVNQRPDLFAGVLYAGVPRGCINILGPMRNGDPVLFNEKLLTAKVNFSIRTSFLLLPDDGFCFVDSNTGESYNLDFHDPQAWVNGRLSPCVAPTLPAYGKPTQQHQQQPGSSSHLTSLLPNTFLRNRSDSKSRTADAPPSPPSSPPTSSAVASVPPTTSQTPTSTSTAASAPNTEAERAKNMEYLSRTLAATKLFRSQLAHDTDHQEANAYPPLALIYGKDIPTVYAARVVHRDVIPCADAYDDLVFHSGDGVVLAKEAMLPEGYSIVKGGRVSSERGHITLLGDMPALGKALESLIRGRRKGIGMGAYAAEK